jgi:phage baseplate assembly protein W
VALPKGFDTPFRLVSEQSSPNVVEGLDCFDRSIRTIIRTFPGERVYRPTFGCLARASIFANMTDAMAVQLGSEIRRAVASWEPRVSIEDILFELDNNIVRLQISWRPSGRETDSTTIIEYRI